MLYSCASASGTIIPLGIQVTGKHTSWLIATGVRLHPIGLNEAASTSLAKQHGEALLKEGYGVMIGTAAAPRTRHATWNINY